MEQHNRTPRNINKSGCVLTLQTAGKALKFNPHLHGVIVINGVFLLDGTFGRIYLRQRLHLTQGSFLLLYFRHDKILTSSISVTERRRKKKSATVESQKSQATCLAAGLQEEYRGISLASNFAYESLTRSSILLAARRTVFAQSHFLSFC